MAGWCVEEVGGRWPVVRVCDDGYRAQFAPCSDPILDNYDTRAAALEIAATLNALDGEESLRS